MRVKEPDKISALVRENSERVDTPNGFFTFVPDGDEIWFTHVEGKNDYFDGIVFDLVKYAQDNGFKTLVYASYRKRGCEFFGRFAPVRQEIIGQIARVWL